MTKEYRVLSSTLFSQTADWNIKQFFNKTSIHSSFELKKIGNALTRRKDQITVKDDKKYNRITIKTNCGGIAVRDEVLGKEIRTKSQYSIKAGQLAVSKIDARNGAFGIVPPQADGAIITGNFWVYDVDPETADARYLILLLSADIFVQAWQNCSNGSGNRLYLQENKFLNYKIPMPETAVQNDIVNKYYAQISAADAKLSEARRLEDRIDNYISDALSVTQHQSAAAGSRGLITKTRFKNLIDWGTKINSSLVKPQDLFHSARYNNVPIEYYCEINPKTLIPDAVKEVSFIPMECVSDVYGEIIQRKDGETSKSRGYTLFQENDIIWAKITPCMQNGKCAVADHLKNGLGYGSTEFHVFRPNENVLPEYLHCFLRSKKLRETAKNYFTGSAGQQRVGADFFRALTIPELPAHSPNPDEMTQEKFTRHISEMKRQIKALYQEAALLRENAKKEFESAVFCDE